MLSAKGVGVAVISDPLAPGELYAIDMTCHKKQPELRKLTSMNDEWLSNVRLGSVQKIAFPCKDTREYTHIGHRAIRRVFYPCISVDNRIAICLPTRLNS